MTSYLKGLLDKLLSLQKKFLSNPSGKMAYKEGKGNVGYLRITGSGGDDFLLKAENRGIKYADEGEEPDHIFTTSEDTFLNILSGEEGIREAVTKGHFTIEDAETQEIDVVEMEKWSKTFNRLRGLIRKVMGG